MPPVHAVPHDLRVARMRRSLEALALGDSFGERFFAYHGANRTRMFTERMLPPRRPWHWTDDTAMAISIFTTLRDFGEIRHDELARRFAQRYMDEPTRGYGPGMRRLLPEIHAGGSWRDLAKTLFKGGSLGNGSAMRVAPLGGYFAEDLRETATQAARSAEPTHAHPEGLAGAIAVAVAAAKAWQIRARRDEPAAGTELIEAALEFTPPGLVREGIARALKLPRTASIEAAVAELENGSDITCIGTVPFVLWSAARNLGDLIDALWDTASGEGDIDTNCAMVGGIVGLAHSDRPVSEVIPSEWLERTEPLPI